MAKIDQLMSTAVALHRAGRAEDAVPLYREVLRRDPTSVEAHRNLGSACNSLGRLEEAARCYERVIRRLPGDHRSHAALGRVLQQMGQTEEALEHLAEAYIVAPDEPGNRARLVAALTRQSVPRVSARLRRALTALSGDDAVRHQQLVPAVAGALKREPAIAKALRQIRDRGRLAPPELVAEIYQALSDPLFLRLLRDCVVSDDAIEGLLTAARSVWLEAVVEGTRAAWPREELSAAVALQALTTEWMYSESPEERAALARLTDVLSAPEARVVEGAPSRALQVYSMYGPLEVFAEDAELAAIARNGSHAWSDVLRRHLEDPGRERSSAASLPRLSQVEGDVSTRVRAQYEERPYPRWRTLQTREPQPLGEVLAATLRAPELAQTVTTLAPRILVAGCGTGRHAVATATRFIGAEVLALDLSLTSLGFAARQAEDLDVANISFAQADILGLRDLPDRFDVVECVGVLHHMESPEAGWGVLRGLLEPHGLMRIGLYSERGRAVVDAARAMIRERGIEPTVDGVRAARAAVRALPEDDPVRRIALSPDFHSLSGCRDVFFPAHEDRFDVPRVARALEDLELEFLGFELPDERVRQLYHERFPRDRAARDLANWNRLEAEFPSLFVAMYAFWCRALS